MGDEQHCGSQRIGEHLQVIKDLLLHGHIKRGGRLVGDQQFRTACQADGDERTLAHTTGKLVRILACTSGGIRQTCLRKKTCDAVVHGGADYILLGDVPSVILGHAGLDQVVGHAPTRFRSRDPLRLEVCHGLVEVVAGLADLGQRFLRRGQQLRKILGAKESLIVVVFKLDISIGESLRQRGTLLMGDIHIVGDQRLLHLGADTPHRIQVAHRILRDKTHLVAAQLVEIPLLVTGDFLAIKLDGSSDHMACAWKQTKHCHSGRGLAGAGLTNDSHPLTRVYAERGVAHRMYRPAIISGEVDLEVLDFQQRTVGALHGLELVFGIHFSHRISLTYTHARLFGSSASFTASPIMMKASTVMASAADG